jgi:hypothetical protein
VKTIIFVDLDNWISFFDKLHAPLPQGTFVWCFHGGKTIWKRPTCQAFTECESDGNYHMQRRSGLTKNASDFALCYTVGRTDALLPQTVSFTIVSGDKGLLELQRQMRSNVRTRRRILVIDPHHKTSEELCQLIESNL